MSYIRTGRRRGLGAIATLLNPALRTPVVRALAPSVLPIMPAVPIRNPPPPTVIVAPVTQRYVPIRPMLRASGMMTVSQLPPRISTPIMTVPRSILPPMQLTIANPLPLVQAPTLEQVAAPTDTVVSTPAGPVVVPATNSPTYSGGGSSGGGGGGGGGGGDPGYQEEETADTLPVEMPSPAAASSGIPLWALLAGGGLALWLLTRNE